MNTRDLLIAIAVPMIWGGGFTVAKDTIGEFPPVFLMGLRFTLAALVLVWFVKPIWDRAFHLAFVALIGGTLAYGLQFTGLKGIDASTAVVVVQLEVVFLAIFAAIFFKDSLDWKQWIAMFIAFVGTAVIAGEPRVQASMLSFTLVLIGGFVWAVGQTLIKAFGNVGGMRLIAWFAAFAGPQLLVTSFLVEDGQWTAVVNATWVGWLQVLYLSVFMTATAYALWFHLLGNYRMNQVAPFILLVPVTTIASAVLFLDEMLTPQIILGGVLVLSAVSFIHIQQARTAQGD